MARVFSVVEWRTDPQTDLALVRVEGGRVGEVVHPVGRAMLLNEETLVCFRVDELADGRKGGRRARLEGDRIIDANLLARIVLPTEESHGLPALAAKFGLEANWPEPSAVGFGPQADAGARARAAAQVWLALLKALTRQPIPILAEMSRLLKPTGNPLFALVETACNWAIRKGFGTRERRIEDLIAEMDASAMWAKRPSPRRDPAPLDVDVTCAHFSPEGNMARSFPTYEYRPEQLRMVREVCEAFNEALVLLVEAGTGTGKSLAYLVPAIAWAVKNDEPVIVSTNTKNLQMQLFRKDLPFLEKALGGAFRYALIKGRANYLCVRKLLMVLRSAEQELNDADRVALLPILTWLPKTRTGDIAENSGFSPGMASALWGMISTRPDECLGPRCRWARRCFVRKARAIAAQSDIIVANHATVFWEVEDQNVALPPYRCIIFDEAHNLEDVATRCFETVAAPWHVPRVLNRLFRARRDGTGQGLLANLRFQLSRASRGTASATAKRLSEMIGDCIGRFPTIRRASDSLFDSVEILFQIARLPGDKIRYDADHRPEGWPTVAHAVGELVEALGRLADALDALCKLADPAANGQAKQEPSRSLTDVAAETGLQAVQLRTIVQALNTLLRADDEKYVYWAERDPRRGESSLCAAPIDIGDLMEQKVYSRVWTAVFTSATLTADRAFDFMRGRLGMWGPVSERLREADLGSSFDFPRQVFLAAPLFLPEPRSFGPRFVGAFCELAVSVLKATRGRGLVLFTSHAMLREADRYIRPDLAAEGIRVFCQGVDGERSRLMSLFAKQTSSVLLGTQSFWEGMDVPGESLSCLILAKLPFRPHTDPLVSARCEHIRRGGGNPFGDYMVPDAVIRLKQGFGRLIRTRQDRGVVIVCDPRVMTKGYGRAFRDSLPAQMRGFPKHEDLLASVRRFLGKK